MPRVQRRRLGQRPREGILVVVPVVEKTADVAEPHAGWRVVVIPRAPLDVGTICSLASRVFFEAIAVADE